MTETTPAQDDRLILAALGGLAYVLTVVLHEAIGRGVGCLIGGGQQPQQPEQVRMTLRIGRNALPQRQASGPIEERTRHDHRV